MKPESSDQKKGEVSFSLFSGYKIIPAFYMEKCVGDSNMKGGCRT